MAAAKIRLYVDHRLGQGQSLPLNRDAAHYLFGVMRLGVGDNVLLFNGRDGEFLARVEVASKRNPVLLCQTRTRALQLPPDLWLLFAPIKKMRTDFIVEKAVEMGVARIMPMLSEFTNNDRIRQEKLQAHAVEAAEQCGATYVPPVADLQKLGIVLDGWPPERRLMFADETLVGPKPALVRENPGPWAIIIGPEGGFSDAERTRLRALKQTRAISLGPRILRSDTAVVAALTLWQTAFGDW